MWLIYLHSQITVISRQYFHVQDYKKKFTHFFSDTFVIVIHNFWSTSDTFWKERIQRSSFLRVVRWLSQWLQFLKMVTSEILSELAWEGKHISFLSMLLLRTAFCCFVICQWELFFLLKMWLLFPILFYSMTWDLAFLFLVRTVFINIYSWFRIYLKTN